MSARLYQFKRMKPRLNPAILRKRGPHKHSRKAERRRVKVRLACQPETF